MSACVICDARLDPCGRDGTRCDRCSEPCRTCAGDVALCSHPLTPHAFGVAPIAPRILAHILEGAPL